MDGATYGGSLPKNNSETSEVDELICSMRERLLEAGAAIAQDLGFGRVFTEVLIYLYFSEGERSLDHIETDLSLSKATVSTAARQLERLGLIRRVVREGDRRRYYKTADTIGTAIQGTITSLFRRKLELIGVELNYISKKIECERQKEDNSIEFFYSRVERASTLTDRIRGILDSNMAEIILEME